MLYAEVILPIAGDGYTFSVGDDLAAHILAGCAVSVQFGTGGRKIVTGIVRRLHHEAPPFKTVKPVLGLLFPHPVVPDAQMKLWGWMGEYYMCSLGEVMRAALPRELKASGFSPGEFAADRFSPRRVRVVSLAPSLRSAEKLNETCEALRRRAPKLYAALIEIASHTGSEGLSGEDSGKDRGSNWAEWVPRAALAADSSALAALRKKGVVEIAERELSPTPAINAAADFPLPTLSGAQSEALDSLREALRTRPAALLFGVPSSGKSEVAFHAIASTLARGRDVLLLLPEISLTTHFVRRVREVFGDRVVLCHSALTERHRAEAYLRVVNSAGGVLIVGTRSALFLPAGRLGLVVVDEEQDASYKQHDPAPRYNARDAAIVLARLHGAKVILASATPSLETWANAVGGRYGLVKLTERFGGTLPPEVTISDTMRAARRGERRSHFNKELLDDIAATLDRGRQTILFQNRRGIAPFVECPDCAWVPRCDHCGIPFTLHRGSLRCHYCGAVQEIPAVCPSCGGESLSSRGFGTEKISEEIARLLPTARVARLDRDSVASQRACNRIIDDFEARSTDILVGTQMVTKGLDFGGVSLVGVLNADNLLNHPDFRASERAFQLLAQVAGRAGRREFRGKVVIQTAAADNPVICRAATGDYEAMAAETLAERAMYGYPPYTRLISVMLRHIDRDTLRDAAARLGEILRPSFGEELLGPQPPMVEKIRGEWALVFLVTVPRARAMSQVRETLSAAFRQLLSDSTFRRLRIVPDVDPQ